MGRGILRALVPDGQGVGKQSWGGGASSWPGLPADLKITVEVVHAEEAAGRKTRREGSYDGVSTLVGAASAAPRRPRLRRAGRQGTRGQVAAQARQGSR